MRVLSGVKPTGTLHIGNYFGAIRQFVELQQKYDGFYFVADYHSLNSNPESSKLTSFTKDIIIDYMALGLDPDKSTIFLQSAVPEVLELAFLLSNVTNMGLLMRAHSFKDQQAKGNLPNVGLFYYPLLMAADILLYDSNYVPVGKDQKQHLEITRDIAIKFNELYDDDFFILPEPIILEEVALIPGTDGQKMSKSYGNTIEMFAPEKALKKQIMGIVTDSTPLEEPKDPETCNVVKLFKFFASTSEVDDMKAKYRAGNYGYGHAKLELFEAVKRYFDSARKKREDLAADPAKVAEILRRGSEKARAVAIPKIQRIKKKMGLVGNIY
ncbi:tryptophan--tRNA ligase [Myxococcota bacterium]|nr:tryptophan--tRNA ligase [Myxococcota bacterium]MBU1382023.1 tryptophan--tRNA ligase [Myxococcota bacterium]MBU1495335.1 tryptophan--tRNA ligase [Myxococcota bacterium]